MKGIKSDTFELFWLTKHHNALFGGGYHEHEVVRVRYLYFLCRLLHPKSGEELKAGGTVRGKVHPRINFLQHLSWHKNECIPGSRLRPFGNVRSLRRATFKHTCNRIFEVQQIGVV